MSDAREHTLHWIPITDAMRVRMRRLAPAALDRLDAFGMDDRRESALALLLAGAAPLVGLVLLRWEPGAVLFALFVNLLTGMAEDLGKILRGIGRRADMQREATEDEFVWPMARALSRRDGWIYAKYLPGEAELEHGGERHAPWFHAAFAFATTGFALLLLLGEGSVYAAPAQLVAATLPNVALALATALFHRWNRHPHWRRAGSVRLQTSDQTGLVVFMLSVALVIPLAGRGRELPDASALALAFCGAVLAYGAWRTWRVLVLRGAARWLRGTLSTPDPVPRSRIPQPTPSRTTPSRVDGRAPRRALP